MPTKQTESRLPHYSVAVWPRLAVTLGKTPLQSIHKHGTRAEAEAACEKLRSSGYGSDGETFPSETWVEPIATKDTLKLFNKNRRTLLVRMLVMYNMAIAGEVTYPCTHVSTREKPYAKFLIDNGYATRTDFGPYVKTFQIEITDIGIATAVQVLRECECICGVAGEESYKHDPRSLFVERRIRQQASEIRALQERLASVTN